VAADSTYDGRRMVRVRDPALRRGLLAVLGRLARDTARVCLRYRVTGLAAEAGFFALLSLPPLVLGLVASAGYLGHEVGGDVRDDLRDRIAALASTFVTPKVVGRVIVPTFNEVSRGGRLDILSLGFVLSLWSGSRALNVYVDTVSIMYGLGGRRGIIRTRLLSFSLYVAALLLGVVLIPLMLVGPGLLSDVLRERPAGLARPAVLAVRQPGLGRRPDGPLPRRHAGPEAVAARPARRPAGPGAVAGLEHRAAAHPGGVGRRRVDLRPPCGTDRHPHLVLRPGAVRADRRRS